MQIVSMTMRRLSHLALVLFWPLFQATGQGIGHTIDDVREWTRELNLPDVSSADLDSHDIAFRFVQYGYPWLGFHLERRSEVWSAYVFTGDKGVLEFDNVDAEEVWRQLVSRGLLQLPREGYPPDPHGFWVAVEWRVGKVYSQSDLTLAYQDLPASEARNDAVEAVVWASEYLFGLAGDVFESEAGRNSKQPSD